MNIDYLMLKAQSDAVRTYFISLFKRIMDNDTDMAWLARYLLWRFERENLLSMSCKSQLRAPEKARIDRRCFQLQVLMDVAYIQGALEQQGEIRKISAVDAALANSVYNQSDGSEELMLPLIDDYYDGRKNVRCPKNP